MTTTTMHHRHVPPPTQSEWQKSVTHTWKSSSQTQKATTTTETAMDTTRVRTEPVGHGRSTLLAADETPVVWVVVVVAA